MKTDKEQQEAMLDGKGGSGTLAEEGAAITATTSAATLAALGGNSTISDNNKAQEEAEAFAKKTEDGSEEEDEEKNVYFEKGDEGKEFRVPLRLTKSGRKRATPFPVKLMKVLSEKENVEIIAWTPSGKSFMVLQPKLFCQRILPDEFKSAKYSSFTRKLHRWGFMRHYRGQDAGAFYHKHFQKGRVDLVEKMSCYKPNSGKGFMPLPEPSPIPGGGESIMSEMGQGDNNGALGLAGTTSDSDNKTGGAQQEQQQQLPDAQQGINAAIELEVARRLKDRINAAALSRQTLMMMPPGADNNGSNGGAGVLGGAADNVASDALLDSSSIRSFGTATQAPQAAVSLAAMNMNNNNNNAMAFANMGAMPGMVDPLQQLSAMGNPFMAAAAGLNQPTMAAAAAAAMGFKTTTPFDASTGLPSMPYATAGLGGGMFNTDTLNHHPTAAAANNSIQQAMQGMMLQANLQQQQQGMGLMASSSSQPQQQQLGNNTSNMAAAMQGMMLQGLGGGDSSSNGNTRNPSPSVADGAIPKLS